MTWALTHDDQIDDCRGRDQVRTLVGVLAGGMVLGAVAVALPRVHHRRRG